MYQQIVRKVSNANLAADDSLDQSMDHLVEPSLLPQSSQLLPVFPTVEGGNRFSTYLIKKVRRNPRDLRAHVQRTLLYLSMGDSDAIYAALIDLFLILGNRGLHIRKNLLRQALPSLKEKQVRFLLVHLSRGLDSNISLPKNTVSSLSIGRSGLTQIVRRTASDSGDSDASPLEQAVEILKQNDWLTAMVILENALHHDPGDEAVCRELLSLYRQQQTREAFYKTYMGLIGRSLALPELWLDTEKFFLDSMSLTN